jgi:hypothetical protein
MKRDYVYSFARGYGRFHIRNWLWGFGKTPEKFRYLDIGPFRLLSLRLRNWIKFYEKVHYRTQSLAYREWKRAAQEFPELFYTRSKD